MGICSVHGFIPEKPGSGKAWYNTLRTYLLSQGLRPSRADPCLFCSHDRSLVIAVYVDDLLISSTEQALADDFIANTNKHRTLAAEWKVKNMGRPSHFLGLEIRLGRFFPWEAGPKICMRAEACVSEILREGRLQAPFVRRATCRNRHGGIRHVAR